MEKGTLNYSVHIKGELEKVMSCPVGIYYVDFKNELFYFEPKEGLDRKMAMVTAMAISVMASHRDIENGKAIRAIHENFEHIPEKHVKKEGDKYIYDFRVEGEMHDYITEDSMGVLYGDEENKVYFFEAKLKGFLAPILKRKFFEGILENRKSEDEEKKAMAIGVREILKDWTELDESDIVR
jgi:hypothetical protein